MNWRIPGFAACLIGFAASGSVAQSGDVTVNPNGGGGTPGTQSSLPDLESHGGGAGIQADSHEVLWDLTHGVYLGYEPSDRYTSLVAILAARGFNLTTTTAGVENETLSDFDVLVINVACAVNNPYTDPQVAAIQQFVADGGGLLIMGDNENVWPDHIDPVSQAFGVTTGTNLIDPFDTYITDLSTHPVFAALDEIYYRAAGELIVGAPSQEEAWTSKGEVVVSSTPGSRVIALGDINCFENTYVNTSDNEDFMVNVFYYLCQGGLVLNGKPDRVSSGDTLQFVTRGGGAGKFAMLVAVDVDGFSLFYRIDTGLFDANGEYAFSANVPSGLSGITLTTLTFGFDATGRAVASNPEITGFQ